MAFQPPRRRRSPVPLAVAAVVGIAAIVATYFVLRPGGGTVGRDNVARGDCVPLAVSASSEKAALLGELAGAYNRAGRSFGGRCAAVTVTAKSSGAAMEALAGGWDPRRDGGPVPQVWTPAASSWVGLLRQRLSGDKGAVVPEGRFPSIAQSPLVLAMPRPMAEALGWPDKPIGWADVLGLTTNPDGWGAVGHPEWGRFKLGKTNPHFSTSGLHATVGAYFAATGRSTDLTDADLGDAKVLDFVRGVEAGVVHYGDISLTFLANLAEADARGQGLSYVSAVAVEEKSVFDYNTGNPSGDPKTAGKGAKPRVPLVAVYPKEGTLLSDHPYVVLANSTDDQKAAAADFLAYVQQAPQQKRFLDLAFRGYDGKTGSAAGTANGIVTSQRLTIINPPAPAVLDKAARTWDAVRKRARVLLVIDVSGSMADEGAGGRSKLELAKQAALQSLGLFAPDDAVGLWTFSTEAAGSNQPPYTEKVPIAAVSGNSAALRDAIQRLSPERGTALYATARAASRKMIAETDPGRINAVVLLTDGRNEYRDNDLDALLRDLDATGRETSVRLFTVAYGGDADLGVLDRISKATRAAAYDAHDPATIDKVMVSVLSNF